ncbi:MAG: ABC transporter permease [Actinomycetota bacterium]|nr:ABC transporter permease [Actinomycetota bacterium]
MNPRSVRLLRSPLVLLGGGIVVVLVIVAVLAPLLSPYDPQGLSGSSLEPPSADHPLGTNHLGQDILSEIIWGTRTSLGVGSAAATLAVSLGVLVGVAAGLMGGVADTLATRVVDVFLALPRLPLLLVVAALVGSSRVKVAILIGLVIWPVIARYVRSQALTLRQRGFVDAARGFGGGFLYVMRRHLVPAVAPLIVAGFVAVTANAMLLEAGLAFLGLGDPSGVSWGLMLNEALAQPGLYFTPAWTWSVLPAGFAISLAVLGFTFLGVGLEPALNPRWRRGL